MKKKIIQTILLCGLSLGLFSALTFKPNNKQSHIGTGADTTYTL